MPAKDAFLKPAPRDPRGTLLLLAGLLVVLAPLLSSRESGSPILDGEASAVGSIEVPSSLDVLPPGPTSRSNELGIDKVWAGGEPWTEPPKIAIVFDDLGYSTEGLARELLDVPVPLTFAVLPDLRESAAFAESAFARGHEVILHLPMEPLDLVEHDPGANALLTTLSPEQNLRRLRHQLNALPFFLGVSNHMGSRFSADSQAMGLVLDEISRRDSRLFFLDSHTTPHTVIPEAALHAQVACRSNNLFLDGPGQTTRLEAIARRRGEAIGIGHVRPETVAAVRDAVVRWQQQGIRLVGLSDLMHRGPEGTLVRLEDGEENDASRSQHRPRRHGAGGSEGATARPDLGRPSL